MLPKERNKRMRKILRTIKYKLSEVGLLLEGALGCLVVSVLFIGIPIGVIVLTIIGILKALNII